MTHAVTTVTGPLKDDTRTSRVIQGENIKNAIQRLVNKITSSFSLSQTHMNAIHPVLIANEHGYKDVPAQDKHRDFSRGQCVRHTCYTLMLALKDSFELDIQPSSHMDSGRGYMRVKIERGQAILFHGRLRHGGLAGPTRLHVYMSTMKSSEIGDETHFD